MYVHGIPISLSLQTNPRLGGYQTIFLSLYADTFISAARTYLERFTFFLSACLSRCSFNSGSSSTVNIVRFMDVNVILNTVLQNFLQIFENYFWLGIAIVIQITTFESWKRKQTYPANTTTERLLL